MKGVAADIVLRSPLDCMDIGEEFLPNPMPWTSIPAAYYRPVMDLAPTIEKLKRNSEIRQSTDARFVAYSKMLARVETMNKACELPLQLDARRKLALDEKALLDLQDSLVPEGTPDAEKDSKKDLVLNEALDILSDLVGMQDVQAALREQFSGDEGAPDLARDFADWFHEALQR
jgi:hypothetical protein